MLSLKVVSIIDFRQKSKMAAKMVAMKAAKTRPWDNISRLEHRYSFGRHLEDYKKVS